MGGNSRDIHSLISAANARWAALSKAEEIRLAELREKVRIVREICSISGVIIVPMDGIENNTVVVSRETYGLMKELANGDLFRMYEKKVDELSSRQSRNYFDSLEQEQRNT